MEKMVQQRRLLKSLAQRLKILQRRNQKRRRKNNDHTKHEIDRQLENTVTKKARTEDNATPKVQEENVTEESKEGQLDNNMEIAVSILNKMMQDTHNNNNKDL